MCSGAPLKFSSLPNYCEISIVVQGRKAMRKAFMQTPRDEILRSQQLLLAIVVWEGLNVRCHRRGSRAPLWAYRVSGDHETITIPPSKAQRPTFNV